MLVQSSVNHIKDSESVIIFPIYAEGRVCCKIKDALGYDLSNDVDRTFKKITKVNTFGKMTAKYIYFVGLGSDKEISYKKLEDAFSAVVRVVEEDVVTVDLKRAISLELDILEVAKAFGVASYVATYEFTKVNKEVSAEKRYELVSDIDLTVAINSAVILGKAINNARTLGDTPSNLFTPNEFEDYAVNLAKELNVEISVLRNKQLKEIGATGLLAVNQGSDIDARLLILKYNGGADKPYTALVGKGVTFDTGGYNLKPSTGMTSMKGDMCGAANIISAFEVIAKEKMPVNVYAIVSTTENMINGSAYKCDDVITMLNKLTVEVTNTDAEGRIVLGDAITYACGLNVNRIIDAATLTGAVGIAVGRHYTGTFTNDDSFYQEFVNAAEKTGENIWRLPLDDVFTSAVKKSSVADLVNSTGSVGGGASIGAAFLQEFVEEGVSWIHLDIAGASKQTEKSDIRTGGSTGVMVRTISELFK